MLTDAQMSKELARYDPGLRLRRDYLGYKVVWKRDSSFHEVGIMRLRAYPHTGVVADLKRMDSSNWDPKWREELRQKEEAFNDQLEKAYLDEIEDISKDVHKWWARGLEEAGIG